MSVPHQQQAVPSGTDYGSSTYQSRPAGWVVGMAIFATTMMVVIGFFHVVQGLAALFQNEIYVVGAQYVFSFDLTAWGWTHLIVGILLVVAGLGVLSGNVLARTVAVILAGASLIVNFLFIPAYPVWALTIIALDVFVILALTVHGRDLA